MLIDTDEARRELENAGTPGPQVEAQLNVLRMLDTEARSKLATEEDLKRTEERLEGEIKLTEERLRSVINSRLLIASLSVVTAILAGMWGLLELYL